MEIYLVRHTKVAVPPGIVYGHTDVSLSDSFEEEAAVVRKKVEGICFDAVWSSPLSRCVRLANYCGFRNIQTDDRLKELNFGEWELKIGYMFAHRAGNLSKDNMTVFPIFWMKFVLCKKAGCWFLHMEEF